MPDELQLTRLLCDAAAGDAGAAATLAPIIYDNLRAIAHRQRGPANSCTLNTTALVNETYMHLFGAHRGGWADRRCFFVYAAKAMRSVLIDYARRSVAEKRGGADLVRLQLSDIEQLAGTNDPDSLLDLDRALSALAAVSPRLAEITDLHLFAGLEFKEIALCLDVTERTVYRDWSKARAFLNSFYSGECAT